MNDIILKKIKDIQRLRRQYVKDRFIKEWRIEAKEFMKYIVEEYHAIEKIEDLMWSLWLELDEESEHFNFSYAVVYNVNSLEIIDMLWRYLEVYIGDDRLHFSDWV